jgi:hypothetical protein
MKCKRRFTNGYVPEEGAQGAETIVSRSHAIASIELEVFEEFSQERCVKIFYSQFARSSPNALFAETE